MNHPIAAFFRNGQPVPLTGADFAHRYNCDMQSRINAIAGLQRDGLIRQCEKSHDRIYELTDAGVSYARSVLCIREARA